MKHYAGYIKFKNVSSKTVGLIMTAPPLITHSEIYGEPRTIPGRDGSLFDSDTYRGDAVIKCSFALAASSTESDFESKIRAIYQWIDGTGNLVISDAEDAHYEVKRAKIVTDSRIILNLGTIEVEFTCYPYKFLDSGDTGITSFPITNSAMKSKPLYKITGSGSGTLTVNGKTMSYTVDGTLYIDTRRFIAYDGSNNNKNNAINGDYAGLYLKTGSNTISASVGTLTVYPKWGYSV